MIFFPITCPMPPPISAASRSPSLSPTCTILSSLAPNSLPLARMCFGRTIASSSLWLPATPERAPFRKPLPPPSASRKPWALMSAAAPFSTPSPGASTIPPCGTIPLSIFRSSPSASIMSPSAPWPDLVKALPRLPHSDASASARPIAPTTVSSAIPAASAATSRKCPQNSESCAPLPISSRKSWPSRMPLFASIFFAALSRSSSKPCKPNPPTVFATLFRPNRDDQRNHYVGCPHVTTHRAGNAGPQLRRPNRTVHPIRPLAKLPQSRILHHRRRFHRRHPRHHP